MSEPETPSKSKSLAELRKSPHVKPPTADVIVCLSTDLARDFDALNEEFLQAVATEVQEAEDEALKPRRLGSKGKSAQANSDELAAKMDALIPQMSEHQVLIRLGGKTAGDWNLWKSEHPARVDADGKVIKHDQEMSRGICDFDALIQSVSEYLLTLNGDEPGEGDWQFVADMITSKDLDKVGTAILGMFEGSFQLPFSRASWLANLRSSRISERPKNEE